jgi:two-component system invasion response regulator UvrY
MLKVLIADDHTLIREGLKKILQAAEDISLVVEAQNAREVIDQVRKQDHLDIVILDISLPDKSGLELLKDLKQSHPKLPVLILSMHPEHRFAVRALKAGASGYVTKETAVKELVEAVRKAVEGRKYVSTSLAERMAMNLEADTGSPLHESLSDRELQVLSLIASGKTVKQIAAALFISTSTVNTYRARIFEKMRMKTDAELIRYAVEKQLID